MKLHRAMKSWSSHIIVMKLNEKEISLNGDEKDISLNRDKKHFGTIYVDHESGKGFQYQRFVGVQPPKKYSKEVQFLDEQFEKIDWEAMELNKKYYDNDIPYKEG